MLIVLNARAWTIDPDVAYIQSVGNIVRKGIVTEHGNAIVNRVPVPCRLAFRQNRRAVGSRLNRRPGHWDVGHPFN